MLNIFKHIKLLILFLVATLQIAKIEGLLKQVGEACQNNSSVVECQYTDNNRFQSLFCIEGKCLCLPYLKWDSLAKKCGKL